MATNYTDNIHLELTPADTVETFKSWREKIDSNFELIDAEFGEDSNFFALASRGSHIYHGNDMSGNTATSNAYSYASCPASKIDDIYINTTNGNVYACTTAGTGSSAKWTYQYNLVGAKGDKGDTGVSITSVVQTTTSSADGGNNVVTVTLSNGSTSTFSFKNGSKGSNGNDGDDGARGSQWFDGTAMSGTSTTTNAYSYAGASNALVGDYYLNTTYGYVYRCTTAGSGTTAKWTYRGSIRGAAGSSASVTVDSALSSTSTNPVQNKVITTEINELDNRVSKVESSIQPIEYGLRWVTGQSDPAGERVTRQYGVMSVGNATGMQFKVESDGSFTSSYDNAYPWSEIKRVTLHEQIMVQIPKYYICLETVDGYDYMWVCKSPIRSGYHCASIFLRADGATENDFYYVGAYESCNCALGESQSGRKYSNSEMDYTKGWKLKEYREAAQSLGNGWGITTMAEIGDFWQIILPIEFGTRDVQSIAAGICSLVDGPHDDFYEELDYHTGMTDSVNNHHGIALVTSNAPDGTNYNYNGQTGLNCGANPFVYRGIENPYGCLEKWVDGLTFYNGTCYTTNDRSAFKTDSIAGYTQLGYNHATEYGYVKTLGYDANVPYCRIPTEVTQTSGTYYADFWDYYAGSGYYCATFGGYYYGDSDGVWYFSVDYSSSSSYGYIGSRLSYSPV